MNNTKEFVHIILNKIAIEISKASNIWYRLKLILLFLIVICWGYFFFINPYILKLQMSNNATQKESDIMYLIHQVSPAPSVKYFEIIPIVTGDRIFIIKYTVNDIDSCSNKVKKSFEDLGWENDGNDLLRKNNFIVAIKKADKSTLQITIASIETQWGKMRLDVNQFWSENVAYWFIGNDV